MKKERWLRPYFLKKEEEKDDKTTNLQFYLPTEPDKELLIWEKWIQIRKEETTKLGRRIQKPPVDLTMNLIWDLREDKERKTALEYAQIEEKPTVRDTLWEQAPRLLQRCYCKPVYEIHRTPAEMGRPNVIEHISVPAYIKVTEMGMEGVPQRKPCPQLNADYEKYRDKREFELDEKIKKIDPYRPFTSELIIKGAKPATPPKKLPLLPVISISEPPAPPEEPLTGVYAVRINNTLICKEVSGQTITHLRRMQEEGPYENCTNWTYYFNVPTTRAGRAKLYLQNLGTVTLRYCWKKIKKPIPFIPEDIYEQAFFFNKNEDVLSPGQSKYIHFTFVSDKSGIFSETWEIYFCNICFFDNLSDKLIVNLIGDSAKNAERIKKKIEILKSRIDRKTVYNMIGALINDAFDKVFAIVPQIYPYKKFFLEGQFFVMKNPVCFYHQTEVAKMKEFYTEMVPRESWDLSIGKWRAKMMEKDYDDRMKYYELLRKSHSELLKPWYEGDELLKHKYRIIKSLLKQLANKFDMEYARITDMYVEKKHSGSVAAMKSRSKTQDLATDPVAVQNISNLFYLHAYEHVATTIELCAGVLSSLDLDKWIQFDFCRV